MRSRTGLASPVENQACGIARYPRLRVHRHEGTDERCEVSPRTIAAPSYAFWRSVSFDPRRELINYCCSCFAHDFVLGIRASRATDCADNHALVDQWNTASRRNDSIERQQIVEVHKVDTILEDLRWARKVTAARALEWRRASRPPFAGRQPSSHRNRLLLIFQFRFLALPQRLE
jgi:hypothetical protein